MTRFWAEHRTHYLPNAEQIGYVLCHGRGLDSIVIHRTNETKLSPYHFFLLILDVQRFRNGFNILLCTARTYGGVGTPGIGLRSPGRAEIGK